MVKTNQVEKEFFGGCALSALCEAEIESERHFHLMQITLGSSGLYVNRK